MAATVPRKSDATVMGGATQRGFTFVCALAWLQGRRWPEVVGDFGGRGCSGERERGKSCRGAGKKKGVRKIKTLNKPYGLGSFNNRGHTPLMASAIFQKCSPFLASGLLESRHIIAFGTGFG